VQVLSQTKGTGRYRGIIITFLIFREAVEAAKAIVTKLKLKHFTPVENPVLQSTYRMIEEPALCFSSLRNLFASVSNAIA
jgi:hypothetical protein